MCLLHGKSPDRIEKHAESGVDAMDSQTQMLLGYHYLLTRGASLGIVPHGIRSDPPSETDRNAVAGSLEAVRRTRVAGKRTRAFAFPVSPTANLFPASPDIRSPSRADPRRAVADSGTERVSAAVPRGDGTFLGDSAPARAVAARKRGRGNRAAGAATHEKCPSVVPRGKRQRGAGGGGHANAAENQRDARRRCARARARDEIQTRPNPRGGDTRRDARGAARVEDARLPSDPSREGDSRVPFLFLADARFQSSDPPTFARRSRPRRFWSIAKNRRVFFSRIPPDRS